MTLTTDAPLLDMRDIVKSYPGVQALRGVSLDVRAGEVHALVGENGAGKSTLMKILAGAERKDGGTIRFAGEEVELRDPLVASRLGITMIYQEFNLVPQLSIAENVFLGREPIHGPLRLLDRPRLWRESREILGRLGLDLDPKARVAELSIAKQQMVEIAKALSRESRLIVMDEPSATLSDRELEALFRIIAALKSHGVAIVYISHRLEELDRIADRVTVLRDGEKIGTARVGEISRDAIIRMMVGRELREEFPPRSAALGDVALRVRGLSRRGVLHDVSFEV
ncbi:MAG: sugar ABC transporter ATP-binding protein, partial [Planctomycetes bacterium]|nr:sugar ABC transporter ATP-binding protein [Planctomycetota bacterium]